MDEIEVIEVDSSANSEEEPIPDTLAEENNNDADVDEVESNAETEPTLEIINVSEEDVEVINIESAFPALGESNESLQHTLLTCRDSADQHPISAITGLRAELNSIEALKTVLSDKRVLAEYYPWDDGNDDLEDRIGYFVKVVNSNDSSDHIQITNSDIFGVTIENNAAGFIGGQASPARGYDYGLVAIVGNVPVLRESNVAAGDYVIPNANGIAKKSNVDRSEATTYINTQISNYNNELTRINTRINALNALDTLTQDQQEWLGELEDYKELVDVKILELQAELARKNIRYGYRVTSIGNDGGTLYANIDLVPQILPLYTFQNEIADMEDRLISDEYNITVAMNRANNAYELADSSANSANSAAQSASSASQSASTAAQQASNASASAAAAKEFVENVKNTAATEAQTMRTQAVNVANNAVSQVNAVKSKTDGILMYTDPITGDKYFDFKVDLSDPQEGHLSGNIESMEGDIEENQSAILQNSKQIQLMVSSMDKYSVGPLSQIYGLTHAEICTILPKEFVYVPTVTHTENYLKVNDQDSAPSWAANTYYRYDDEDEEYVLTTSAPSNWSTTYKNYYKNHSVTFTQYYAYTWDGEEWNEPVDENVFFNGGAVPTATSVFIYWYSGSGDEMITGIDDTKYLSKTLHKWMDNKWAPVATLDNNSLSRSVSLIKQTADSILQTVTNTKGDAASIKTWVDENQAAVQQVATWKGQLGNDTLATVKTWASEGSTGVSQIAQNIGTDGIVTAASIVTAINNQTGESIIGLDADRINFNGKIIDMSASNDLTITAGNGFRLDKNGVYWTTESNPTKMIYSQVLQTNPPANGTQYSSFPASSTVGWHKNLTSADKYASETTDGGATWGAVRKIVGEDGTSVNIKGNCYISTSPTVGTTYSIYYSTNHSTQITGASVGDGYIDETYGNLFVCTDVDGQTFTCVGKIKGDDGNRGSDGTSIIFKGSYASAPANPQNGWSYYNTTAKASYVYQDNTWYQMSVDGINGQNGSDGLSIVWKGESSTAPSNPQDNWVYKNAYNGIVYIYDSSGSGWEPMVLDGSDGADGANGTNGLSVFITYNDTDSSTTPSTPTGNGKTGGWHTEATSSSIWMSQKVSASATDGTWGTPIRIKGNSGTSAYFFVRYSANANGNPMTTSPQSDTAYMGVATTTTNSAPASYTAYTWTKIKGNDGANGVNGQDGHTIQVVRAYKLGTSIPPTITHNGNALPTGWTASPSGVTASNPYEYVSECVVTDGVYGTWSSPAVYAHFGSDATVNADNVFNALTSNGTKFGLFNSSNNKLYINASYINTGELRVQNSSNTVFSASVSSGTCTIGGWEVSSTSLKSGSNDNNYIYLASDLSSAAYWIRAVYGGNTKFGVKKDGELYATGADISGTITANAGSIGGWDITSTNISAVKDSVHLYLASPASTAGYWIRAYKEESGGGTTTYFGVKRDGTLYADGANISGTIHASAGTIGGCSISNGTLTVANANIGSMNVSKLTSGTNTKNLKFSNLNATGGSIGLGDGETWSIGSSTINSITLPSLYCSSSWKISGSATSASVYLTPLYVQGNYGSGGSTTTWYKICSAANSGSSDSRIKNDITDLTDESFDLFFDNLKAKTFSYAENSGIIDGGKTHIGFVAQDILQNLSDNNIDNSALVEDCEYYSLRYNEFTALNTWQIQKLKTRVSELEAKLAELENKIG